MLYLAFLACLLISYVNATVRCNNSTETGMSFEPSTDGVMGRYTVKWCTKADENITGWELILRYYETRKPEKCQHYDTRFPPRELGRPHSYLTQYVEISPNCSNVCLSTPMDLIFKACYAIKSTLIRGRTHLESHDSFHYVTNNFTDIESLKRSRPAAHITENNDYVTVLWILGTVPAVNYSVVLCRLNTTLEEPCFDVTENCTSDLKTVLCKLNPPAGSYTISFEHRAPWYHRVIPSNKSIAFFLRSVTGVLPVEPGSGTNMAAVWWGLLVGATAAVLCSVGAVLRYRARLHEPPAVHLTEGLESESKKESGGIRVLLLYARDCAPLMEVARQLAALLRHVAPGRVYDLYSAEVCAQAASAPGEWVRALLARPDVRVVVLQTPAAACLYGTQLRQRGYTLALEQPLLGGRVLPRSPHCSDALLQLALRMLCESAAQGAHVDHYYPYRKYYVTEILGLKADVVPLVTPQRRYVLPEAAALLLTDLAGIRQDSQHVQLNEQLEQFSQAVYNLLAFVRDNPDYLNDELLFL